MNATLPKDDAAGRERLAWLRLACSEGVGAITLGRLIERFGTAERALAALPLRGAQARWSATIEDRKADAERALAQRT
jgi:DNA processing protein